MPYPDLRPLRIQGVTLFKVNYVPQFAPFRKDLEVLTSRFNVLHPKFQDVYASLPKDTLRWVTITAMSAKVLGKSVVREHLRRRWREAFREALKRRGFSNNGKVLPHAPDAETKKPLYGTMEVHIYAGLGLNAKFPVLVQQAGTAIDAIARECDKHPNRP